MTLQDFQTRMHEIESWSTHGCGNSGCQIYAPKGMRTNGGCQCDPSYFANALRDVLAELDQHGKYGKWDKP